MKIQQYSRWTASILDTENVFPILGTHCYILRYFPSMRSDCHIFAQAYGTACLTNFDHHYFFLPTAGGSGIIYR